MQSLKKEIFYISNIFKDEKITNYENKYKQEVQKFANEQVGRRRRDDYTDGAVRIPINSANP